MEIKKRVIWYVLWLSLLTATVQGYRSCSQIQEHNEHGIEKIKLDGREYDVQCNMSAHPATTIVKVLDAKDIMIQNPALHSKSFPFIRKIEYRGIPVKAVQELVNISEHCKQFVSYKCKNASLFGDEKSPLSYWVTPKDDAKFYWSDCGHDASGKRCNCDFEKNEEAIDQGYLTKKQDLPVSEVHFGGLKAISNVSFTIGDIVCYGDSQKGSLTFENRNSIVSVDLSRDENEIKFKFKSSSKFNKNKTIATIQMVDKKYIKVGLSINRKLQVSHTFGNDEKPHYLPDLSVVDEEWHSIMVKIDKKDLNISIDENKHPVIENQLGSSRARVVFGDPSQLCNSFVGCVKDLYIGGNDNTTQFQNSERKEFVKKGCKQVIALKEVNCSHPQRKGGDPDGGNNNNKTGDNGGGEKIPRDDDGDGGGGDNTAVIVIVVIFLVLLILLIVVFLFTWYLKRNKGVYQTHEGSAENIHGDTENLTLVTKQSEQELENQNSKEYYL